MRGLTEAVKAHIEGRVVEPFFLVEMDFDDDPVQLWNGVGEIEWDGKTWLGAGDLGEIYPIDETTSVAARGIGFTLRGVPVANLSLALTQDFQGRLATIYMGFFDDDSIIVNPFIISQGRMDLMDIEDTGEAATISVTAESRFTALLRPREYMYDHEDHKILYPDDNFFEYVTSLQDKELSWGVGTSSPRVPTVIKKPPSHPRINSTEGGGPGPHGPGSHGAGGGTSSSAGNPTGQGRGAGGSPPGGQGLGGAGTGGGGSGGAGAGGPGAPGSGR